MAGGGSEDGGVAGAARQFYSHHHLVFLSIALCVLGIATGTATTMAVLNGALLLDTGLILGCAVVAGAIALIQTRHLTLAVLVAVAPLPGLAWAAPMSAGAAFGAVPLLAYVFGYGVAVVQANGVLVRALDGKAADIPFRSAGASVGLMVVLSLIWFWHGETTDAAFQAVLDIAFAGASALLVIPLGTSFLRFDEAFVAEANRTRERRQRVFEKVAMVAVPRWGTSIAGITLIFLALAWFGAEPVVSRLHIASARGLAGASVGLVFLSATIVCGGWREGLSATIVSALVCLMALWGLAVACNAESVSLADILELVSLALFLVFCGARRAHAYRLLGDDPAIARLRAVEEQGAPQTFAVLGGSAALLPNAFAHPATTAYLATLAFAGAGAVALAPAIVTACETLLPRRRSVEELYGKR